MIVYSVMFMLKNDVNHKYFEEHVFNRKLTHLGDNFIEVNYNEVYFGDFTIYIKKQNSGPHRWTINYVIIQKRCY